jgi:hypothetical protein
MEILFLTPQEISKTTIMGGNVDLDKYTFCIAETQVKVIEPLLGNILYDKIVTDFVNDTLTGDYLTIFNNFVKPVTKYESVSAYLKIANYNLTNAGLIKHNATNAELVNTEETETLANRYSSFAQTYVIRFNKFILKNYIVEYQRYQSEINADNYLTLTAGLYFGKN